MRPGAPRVLHIHASFAGDDPQAQRCARLIDAFGDRMAHTVVAIDRDWSAADALARRVKIHRSMDFPALSGLPLPGRMQRVARAMADYDLLLSYGRGAIDAALAHTMFSQLHSLPPLIHHEDGSDETARQRHGLRSKWYRRVGLGKSAGLVVPTETMEHAALVDWQQPLGRVKTIRDGVDLKRFARPARPDAIPRLLKRPGEFWLGCFAAPGGDGDVTVLLEGMHYLPPEWHLVIVGSVPAVGIVADTITNLGLDHRVHIAPGTTERADALALCDIVAVTHGRELLPIAMIEAIAAGKPVIAFDQGEAARCLSPDNADLVTGQPVTAVLKQLTGDQFLCKRTGAANREKALAERDEETMVAAYQRLYSSAIGRGVR